MLFHMLAEHGSISRTTGTYYVCSRHYSIVEHIMREFSIPRDCSQEQLHQIEEDWQKRTTEVDDVQ
ncbi:hypothetical protein LCGC14_2943230 [marine sediment metagenome]|uniref:Uncharacterized protein n=1 Tax=marine sediment metagenome TaxID=412755 RepID=A0A0F8ZQ30_9ZZZZ